MTNLSESRSLIDIISKTIDTVKKDINCAKVAIIQDVNLQRQTVDVLIATMKQNIVGDKRKLEGYCLMRNIPFISLCGGNSALTFPIKKGDECLLFFNDFAIGVWNNMGGIQPPTETRNHDLSDCFALVGLHNSTRLIEDYSEYVKLFHDKYSYLEIKNNSIELKTPTNLDVITPTTNINSSQTNVNGNESVNGNINISGNCEAATYSSGGSAGITDTLSHEEFTLTFTNGLVTGKSIDGSYSGGATTDIKQNGKIYHYENGALKSVEDDPDYVVPLNGRYFMREESRGGTDSTPIIYRYYMTFAAGISVKAEYTISTEQHRIYHTWKPV